MNQVTYTLLAVGAGAIFTLVWGLWYAERRLRDLKDRLLTASGGEAPKRNYGVNRNRFKAIWKLLTASQWFVVTEDIAAIGTSHDKFPPFVLHQFTALTNLKVKVVGEGEGSEDRENRETRRPVWQIKDQGGQDER